MGSLFQEALSLISHLSSLHLSDRRWSVLGTGQGHSFPKQSSKKAGVMDGANNNNDGATPLSTASQTGNLVRLSLPAINQGGGETPLAVASRNGHVAVIRLLINAGVLINKARHDGITPLSMASYNGHVEVVRLLIDAGALINQADNNGTTSLWMASQEGQVEVVRLLINAGALFSQARNDGMTPLCIARLEGHVTVVRLLIDAEAEAKWQRRKYYAFVLNSLKNATEFPGPAFKNVMFSTHDTRYHIASFL